MKKVLFHPGNPGYQVTSAQIFRKAPIALQAVSRISDMSGQVSAHTRNTGNLVHNEAFAKTFSVNVDKSCFTGLETFFKNECGTDFNIFKARISAQFDAVVLSFANMIAPNPRSSTSGVQDGQRLLAELVENIPVPLFVIGIGMQNSISSFEDLSDGLRRLLYSFNDRAIVFGVRGSETQSFLHANGCNRAVAIGCPSLYVYPRNILRISAPEVTRGSAVISAGYLDRRNLIAGESRRIELLETIVRKFENITYVFQNDLLTLGELEDVADLYDDATGGIDAEIMNACLTAMGFQGKIKEFKFFRDPRSWRQEASHADFYFGDRFHGGVTCLQAGVASAFVYDDLRVKELCDHFGLPAMSLSDALSGNIVDLVRKALSPSLISEMKHKYIEAFQTYHKLLADHFPMRADGLELETLLADKQPRPREFAPSHEERLASAMWLVAHSDNHPHAVETLARSLAACDKEPSANVKQFFSRAIEGASNELEVRRVRRILAKAKNKPWWEKLARLV